jgi:hypothetical protein
MDNFAYSVPQRNEITIEIADDGYVEISQNDDTLNPDSYNVIRIHKTDLESLIIGLQQAEKSS